MHKKRLLIIIITLLFFLSTSACNKDLTREDVLDSNYDLNAAENNDFKYDIKEYIPTSEDAYKYLKVKYPDANFDLLDEYKSEVDNKFDHLYQHEIIWTFKDKDNSDLNFQVFVDYNQIHEVDLYRVNYLDNYKAILSQYYINNAKQDILNEKEKVTMKWLSQTGDLSDAIINLSYEDEENLKQKLLLAKKVNEYLISKSKYLEMNFGFSVQKPLINEYLEIHLAIIPSNEINNSSKLKKNLEQKEFLFDIQNPVITGKYKSDNIKTFLQDESDESYQFRLIKFHPINNKKSTEEVKDNNNQDNNTQSSQSHSKETLVWKDLADNGGRVNSISMATLYEILSRLSWPDLKGNVKDFSFTGADKVKYEFSYDFNSKKDAKKINLPIKFDYLNDDSFQKWETFNGLVFYYKANSEKQAYLPQDQGITAIDYTKVEKMLGYFVRKGWSDPLSNLN